MAAEIRALLDLPVDKRAGAGAGAGGRECDKGDESHGMRNGHEVQSDDVWLQRVADQTRRRARDVWTCGVEAQSKWPRRAARYGFGRSG
ncbi:hypothetical protein E4U35_002128 [Claviceps purpurea]|nr:hypothetical protein E4U12_002627 [Claviceps purpurea]KAG6205040.1 hypothetical protein E4U50_004866 [Claviceps purpurea]KAG6205944.1 hypothetical protein E4U35_002128 [Claviceps purpurea]KAG6259227.1 hypothetical protein E4U49_005936 [Claviceps purpurea]KAG6264597.1 hypothetical protein E4U48_006221 [Claviceps purpurea]